MKVVVILRVIPAVSCSAERSISVFRGNTGRSLRGNMGRSLRGNMGRSLRGNMGRSLRGNMGRSLRGDMGRSLRGNMGRSLRGNMGQHRQGHLVLLCIKHPYVNRVDIERVIDEFASKKGRSKFFFQPNHQITLVIHLEPCKKSELVNSMPTKVNRLWDAPPSPTVHVCIPFPPGVVMLVVMLCTPSTSIMSLI